MGFTLVAIGILTLTTTCASIICYNNDLTAQTRFETNCDHGCCLNNVNFGINQSYSDAEICKQESGGCPNILADDFISCPYWSYDYGETENSYYSCSAKERCCENEGYKDVCSKGGICPEDNWEEFRRVPGEVWGNSTNVSYEKDCMIMRSDENEFKTFKCSADTMENIDEAEKCCLGQYTIFYGTTDEDICQVSCSPRAQNITDVCYYKLYNDEFITKVHCFNGDLCCASNYSSLMNPELRLMCYQPNMGIENVCDWRGDGYYEYYSWYYECEGEGCDEDGLAWWIVFIIVLVIIAIIFILWIFCYMFFFKHRVVSPAPTPKDVEAVEDVDTDRLNRLAYVEALLDSSINSKNIAELKNAINETEVNGFERDLNKKYRRAKELLQKLEVQMAKDQADLDRKNAQEKERADRLAYIEGLLDDSIESESVDDLKHAIAETELNKFTQELDEKYRKAKDLLQKKLDRQAKQAEIEKMLDAAIKSKDPEALRKAISEVENHGFEMELDQKYKEAKMLLAELDDRQTRLARVEGMLDSGISSKDPADLQAAIQETEKNGFQDDLEEKYNLAKKALQIYYHDLEEDAKRKLLEEAERLAQLEKERLEEAQRELERLEREKAEAARIAEAQRKVDEAKARWGKLWPRFMILKALMDLHESTVLSSEDRAKLEAELAEKERLRQIELQKIREQLNKAWDEKSIDGLRKAIKACEDKQFEKDLDPEYTRAVKLLERLERIARVRKAVMDLNRPLLAELRSFSTPPPEVHKALIASYLLLGEKKKDVDKWKEVVIMLGKTGKASVKRRVQTLEVENIKVEVATEAHSYIKDLDSETVYEANQAAALFYEWADLMCDETFRSAEENK